LATSQPDVGFWDTGEMETVPWILGIAHPTGFPAFVLGGYLFSHLVPIGSVAWRITCFSALAMAFSAWTLFAAALELEIAVPIAFFAALLFATTDLAWSRGTRAEVHSLALGTIGLTLWLALRYLRTRDLRLLPLATLTLSLGLAVHPVAVFLLPLLFGWAAFALRSAPPRRTLACCFGAILVVPLFYCYLPLRSLQLNLMRADPTLSIGLPPGRPYWDYGHTASWDGFRRELTGSDFTVSGGLSGILSPAVYAQIPARFLPDLARGFGGYGMLLFVPIGLAMLARRIGLPQTLLFAVCGSLAVPFALSYTSEADSERYFLTAYWCIALLFALGLDAVAAWILRRRFRLALPAGALAVMTVSNVAANLPKMMEQHQNHGARAFINRVLTKTPPNAVILSEWTYATPLAYAEYVEGTMGNRILDTAWPANDAAYFAEWMQHRPIVILSTDGRAPANVAQYQALDDEYPQLLLVRKLQAFR
jgi:hypothetical protein